MTFECNSGGLSEFGLNRHNCMVNLVGIDHLAVGIGISIGNLVDVSEAMTGRPGTTPARRAT